MKKNINKKIFGVQMEANVDEEESIWWWKGMNWVGWDGIV